MRSTNNETALEVIRDEKLSENAERLGIILRKGLNEIAQRNSLITLVRGKVLNDLK